jgi:hypothetical protein
VLPGDFKQALCADGGGAGEFGGAVEHEYPFVREFGQVKRKAFLGRLVASENERAVVAIDVLMIALMLNPFRFCFDGLG